MKILVHSGQQNIRIWLPTPLIFSKTLLKLGLRIGRQYSDEVPDLPPQAVDALCSEMRRIKKKHGSWNLVDVQTGAGDTVQITL